MPTYTASIEAEKADEIRAERARTDDDIRAEYGRPVDDDMIRRERVLAAHHHQYDETNAIKGALSRVIHQAYNASATTVPSASNSERKTPANPLVLDGAVLTIELNDLVATATLVLPDSPFVSSTRVEG